MDTEFIEKPNTIDLISIGIVSQSEEKFYALSNSYDYYKASDWVKKNVIAPLHKDAEYCNARNGGRGVGSVDCFHRSEGMSTSRITNGILEFVGYPDYRNGFPEFYGYYADYDWVVFCWLFGSMIDLPKGFPMYCKDIKQMIDDKGNPTKPGQSGAEHDALSDAIYHKELYYWIKTK